MCKTKPLIHREPIDTEFINLQRSIGRKVMGILAMKFRPIGLWRIDKASLVIRTFLFFINKRSCTVYNYHKGKRRTLPYSRQKFAMKFLPIGLWRIDEAHLSIPTVLFVMNKRC